MSILKRKSEEKNIKAQEKGRKQKKKNKNKNILAVTYLFVGVFLTMMGYTCHYAMTHQQELINNSYNGRQELFAAQTTRGTIYAADSQVLAETQIDENGRETRVYPYDNLFAHAVGYASNGKSGIESLSNYYLINSNARLTDKVAKDMAGEKYPGDSVYTTLDVGVQQVAYRSLGIFKGAVVVSEPSTGKIIAMVSKPDFNPNEIDAIWEDLIHDENSTVLLNRATQGLYPPGSTFKIVTALEYIRENPDAYNQYQYQCSGRFWLGEYSISCYHGTSHGSVDFTKSFAKSCNSSFANIGMKLDRARFGNMLNSLLFNQELPVAFAYNKSRLVIDEDTPDEQMIQTVIGQGTTQITPLHLNMITCAIANKGMLMKPYLVDCVKNNDGSIVKQFAPDTYKRLMPEEEASVLKDLMQEVVNSGTATRLAGLSYTAAGKTGSAEYNSDKTDSHAWFTGFAPAEDPQVCVTIIIESAGSGGDYAVPIAKRIFDEYFDL